jgi:putative Ca2+/H+ antiporter (TMEM165/GDT1 family)
LDPKLFATVFGTIFVAELGDKTQLATLLYASDAQASRWTVFAAAAAALVLSSAIGVAAGSQVAQWVTPRMLSRVAGLGFIAIGVWTLVSPPD